MKTKPEDPAFPEKRLAASNVMYDHPGLTVRQYFAAKSLEGIRASGLRRCGVDYGTIAASEQVAFLALQDADALIAVLNGETKQC